MPVAFTPSKTTASADLSGVLPPVVLPMTPEGEVDSPSLQSHVSHLVSSGVHGLWANGTTGEFYALDGDGRAEVVRQCVKAAAGRVPVVAHVGDTTTSLTVRHAREALAAGATFVSVLPPYFVSFGQEELKRHFRELAHAIGVPVLAYHLPQFIPATLSIDSIVELTVEGVLCGAKDSSSNMVWFRQLQRRLRAEGVSLPCLTGGSSVADLGYLLGAVGSVSSTGNLTPAHLVRQYEAAQQGDWTRVLALQEQSEELIELLTPPGATPGPGLSATVYKYLLAKQGRIDCEFSAAPLTQLSPEQCRYLDEQVLPVIARVESPAAELV
ncbi:dihydrodipicolinate synthase family protein [Ruania zhangjianzhongii]|nr:dihydrodipicolinate synthase family protein [Ruania zhangjianzhongii]